MTDSLLMTDVLRGYADSGHPISGIGNDGHLDLSEERVVPLVYVPPAGATLAFEDTADSHETKYDVYATELDAVQQDLSVETAPTRTDSGWTKRAVRLDRFRGKIIGLRFVPRHGDDRSRLVRLRNLRIQLSDSVS
jgi:hypothetical protein